MYGWIHEAIRALIVEKFGGEAKWHEVCRQIKHPTMRRSSSDVFSHNLTEVNRHHTYPDATTVAIVEQIAKILNVDVPTVLMTFGEFFVERYTKALGFSNILQCLGPNLYDFLRNVNILHFYLKQSIPEAKFPEMYATNVKVDGSSPSFKLLYYSTRGALLLPVLGGMVKSAAREYFDIQIEIELQTSPQPAVFIKLHESSLPDRNRFLPEKRVETKSVEVVPVQSPMQLLRSLMTNMPFHLQFDDQLRLLDAGHFLEKLLHHHKQKPLPTISLLDGKMKWNRDMLSLNRKHQFDFVIPDCKIPPIHGTIQYIAHENDSGGYYFFMGSPSLGGLQSLLDCKMTLSDIPEWDLTREFLLLCEHFKKEVAHSVDINNKLVAVKQDKKVALEQTLSREAKKRVAWRMLTITANALMNMFQVYCNLRGAIRIQETDSSVGFRRTYLGIAIVSSIFLTGIALLGRLREVQKLTKTFRENKVRTSIYATMSDRVKQSELEEDMLLAQQIKIMKIQFMTAFVHDLPMIALVFVAISRSFDSLRSVIEPLFVTLFSLIFGCGAKLLMGLEMVQKIHALNERKIERALKSMNPAT